ncbi:Hypothetical predicted protein [Podarcis lilfordi]|uniref:Uncharacterized protein n=1 Tax=Podarcis lilfordi TaxID=74358 RepID=A0AA35P0Z9_9SAUR|nr:Hypothetical predicted protein [Podarcis lilfordi]
MMGLTHLFLTESSKPNVQKMLLMQKGTIWPGIVVIPWTEPSADGRSLACARCLDPSIRCMTTQVMMCHR